MRKIITLILILSLFTLPSCKEEAKDNVTIQTETDIYLPDTKQISVNWINNSNKHVMFGDSWILEKHDGKSWKPVNKDNGIAFTSIAYGLEPGTQSKHVYNVENYADVLSEGRYRIVVEYFFEEDIPITPDKDYTITAEFTV